MTKDLLIIGGCSFSDPMYPGYIEHNVTPWSELISKELGIETLNVSKRGNSNDNITNSIMDAVIDNHDKKLTVMILWSSPNRLNYFDTRGYVTGCHYGIDSYIKDKQFPGFEFDKAAVNFNLRCIWRLNKFLQNNNIEYYQAHSSSLINNISWMPPFFESKDDLSELELQHQLQREAKLIEETPHNRYYDPSFFTTQSFRSNMKWVTDPTCHLSDEDIHPNEKGHNQILEYFLIMHESKLEKLSSNDLYKLDDNYNLGTTFIYD